MKGNAMSLIFIVLILVLLLSGLRIANQYERAVVFRLGKLQGLRGPGLYWLIPFFEWQNTIDIRTVTTSVAQQGTITKDNVPVKVTVVIWYSVKDPVRSVIE